MPDCSLLRERMRLMHRVDEYGRLVATAYPSTPPAPRVRFFRSSMNKTWCTRFDLPHEWTESVDALFRREPLAHQYPAPWMTRHELLTVLGEHAPLGRVHHGPAYYFPPTVEAPADVVLVDASNKEVFVDELLDMRHVVEYVQPIYAVVVDGVAASMCHTARRSHTMAEAGVTTMTAYRGQGFAVRAVAAWARAIRAENRIPLYSTDWNNLGSRGVARRLGLMCYGEDISIQ